MITMLTEGGQSFKGAALYYLHDKREEGEAERLTSDRVAWTYAINLHTQDPERAWKRMVSTANNQAGLKKAAGIKATGRKLKKPVMAYSLSWKPGQTPAPHEMLEAAQSSLAALGLEQHQALVICHNDTAHPHVHIMVNRVNPLDGVAHTGSVAKLKLSTWAEAFERDAGEILCAERVANNAKRQAHRHDKSVPLADRKKRLTRKEWEAARHDTDYAADITALHRELFSEQAAMERAGSLKRWSEATAFHYERRAGRNAIRDRYQAALDAAGDPRQAARHAKLADILIGADSPLALKELTRDRSTFTFQDLARHVGRHTDSVEAFTAVLARLKTSPDLVALGRDDRGRQRFTTREHQAIEQRMEQHARSLNAAVKPAARPLWPKGFSLTKDQDAALRHILQPVGLASIVGFAGTGKSTLLGAARRSWEAVGLQPIGMALSGIAADGLKNGSGIDSRTIHSHLYDWERGKNLPGPKHVIVVDEAGMLGSRLMERILDYATEGKAKVVLVGDPEQLQAIDAGGAFRAIVDRFGSAQLNTVRRQRETWQQDATRELATNETKKALDRYQDAGMVHAHQSDDEAKTAIVDRWWKIRTEKPQATQILLAYTRVAVRDLNNLARTHMRESGALGQDAVLKTELGKRSFAAGDRIYFLKNDRGLGVRNGTLASIVRIKDGTVVARLDGEEGRTIMFGINKYNHIDHGYAATVHKSQGVTVDHAHLLASRNLDRHSAYVAMTRHRDSLDLHWSADAFPTFNKLARTLGREAVKDTSLDYETPDTHDPVAAEHADRIDALRVRRHVRESLMPNAAPDGPVGEKLVKQLRHQADAKRADKELRRIGQPAADDKAPDHAPRQNDRPSIVMTAEMAQHDIETAELARAISRRHDTEEAKEKAARFDLMLDAAENWQEAMLEPIERKWRHDTGAKQQRLDEEHGRRLEEARYPKPKLGL